MMSDVGDRLPAGVQRGGIVPVGGGVEMQFEAGNLARQRAARAIDRARQMIVERDDGHAVA